jgi:eukaryotic-like serine/threonine-protein kinase
MGPATRRLLRFSVFEADLDSGELFKRGQKLKLQGQPFQLLVELLENPGCVVTREHLKDRLWPGDTAGDFDSSLNRAINRIREVLGDSAESPRFVETLPRRGYRFIETVSGGSVVEPTPAVVPHGVDQEAQHPPAKRDWRLITLAGVSSAAVFFLIWAITHGRPVAPRDLKLRQITTNSSENPISGAVLSPDGKYLAYGDATGMRLEEISTGQTHAVPKPKTLSADDAWFPSAWFPDGDRIVASAIKATPDGRVISSAWSVPFLGSPMLLRDDAIAPSVSPDGSMIAFTRGRAFDEPFMAFNIPRTREIWVMGPNGESARKLVSSDGKSLFRSLQWSPDNSRIAYLGIHEDGQRLYAPYIGTIGLKGGQPTVILPEFLDSDFCWIPDGRILYTRMEAAPNNRFNNLWALRIDSRTGAVRGRPRPITNLPGFDISNISVSSDGKKITVRKNSYRSDIYIGRLQPSGQLETPRRLTADESWNLPFAWTLDSQSVIFTSNRTGVIAIYRQEIDQDLAELIPTGPEQVWLPRVTPDGSSIVYQATSDIQHPWQSRTIHIMRVPVSGGARELLMELPASSIDMDCPLKSGAPCVVEEGTKKVFIAFDPLTGKRRELFRRSGPNATLHQWTLSPDGAHIGEVRGNTIAILSLAGHLEKTIEVKGWPYLATIDWTADGKAVLVSHRGSTRATLLRVSLDGKTQPVWGMGSLLGTWAIASPDGHYLAIRGESLNSNAWLLESF